MPSARSNCSTRSPISAVPYDVLREIFMHCLPQYPLVYPQPNTKIAPMLLCQICSSWRTIAFASPPLWSHFSYCLTMQRGKPDIKPWSLRQTEIDFVLWWKRNQGSMAPFLCLDFRVEITDVDQDVPLAGDGMAILQKYLATAQYLQVEPLFWEIIYGRFPIGDQIIFPNVHTLVTYGDRTSDYDIDDAFYDAQVLIGLVPTHPSSTLRRLVINNDVLPEKTVIPNHWSTLTHLSMTEVDVPLNFWFSLIRALPYLQWAYFYFNAIDNTEEHTELTTEYTHPQLSTLFMAYTGELGDDIELPLTLLFTGLHLPTLQTLSLWSLDDSWGNHHAILELYAVLQSTPAITTLTLQGYDFLSLGKTSHPTILAEIGAVEPFWSHVPHLTHLQLKLPWISHCSDADAKKQLDTFVSNIFLANRSWLALDSPACPIQTTTLIKAINSTPDFDTTRSFVLSTIQQHTGGGGGASNIIFEIVSDSARNDSLEEWSKWGSRNY